MKQSHGFWFPDYDNHFPRLLEKSLKNDGVARYQWRAREAAISACENKRICIDIGANVGLWSCELVENFEKVIAFEPVKEFIQCYEKNVKKSNYLMYECALGKEESFINMNIVQGNTGHSHIDKSTIGKGSISLKTLDSFNLSNVDMIKIDVEGFENEILQGSLNTIQTNRPILVIEQQKHEYQNDRESLPAIKFLENLGYQVVGQFNKDYILKIL